jgi:hypothetical protein
MVNLYQSRPRQASKCDWLDLTLPKNFTGLTWIFAGLTSFKRSNWRVFFKCKPQSKRMFSKTLHTIQKIPIVSQSQLVETKSRQCLLPIDWPVISKNTGKFKLIENWTYLSKCGHRRNFSKKKFDNIYFDTWNHLVAARSTFWISTLECYVELKMYIPRQLFKRNLLKG